MSLEEIAFSKKTPYVQSKETGLSPTDGTDQNVDSGCLNAVDRGDLELCYCFSAVYSGDLQMCSSADDSDELELCNCFSVVDSGDLVMCFSAVDSGDLVMCFQCCWQW